jgi:GAF domain-containing protein
MDNKPSTHTTIWQRLIQPHEQVTGQGLQRRTRMLSGLTLVMFITTLPVVLSGIRQWRALNTLALIAAGLFLASYLLARARFPQGGAYLLVLGLVGLNLAGLVLLGEAAFTYQAAIFLIVPMLLAMLLLDTVGTAWLAGVTLVGFLIFTLATPWLRLGDVVIALVAIAWIALIAVVKAFTSEHDVLTIREQSRAVDRQTESLEIDVQRMRGLTDMGSIVTSTRELDPLLAKIVNLLVERFGMYHAQVFLSDETGKRFAIKAASGKAGKTLLERGHSVEVGSQTVVGMAAESGGMVQSHEADSKLTHRLVEWLPNTRSEIALPLRTADRTIGVLDIHSERAGGFNQEEIFIFQTIAGQLTIAIENNRLFEQAQRDLRDIELLNRRLTGEAWRSYVTDRNKSPLGYQASPTGVQPIQSSDDTLRLRRKDGGVSLPLKVRGTTIGALDVTPRKGDEPPDEETRSMLEAVAERVALALDSTRLGEMAEQRAKRDQILSTLSAEFQASSDLPGILKAAARGVSQAFGSSRGFAQLTLRADEPVDEGQTTDPTPDQFGLDQ